MKWLNAVSDRVFPGLSNKITSKYIENEANSNLPLQMALYFNVVFVPVWLSVILHFLFYKYVCYNDLYKFITVAVIFMVIAIELFRLYLGYEGNLRDKIPELAGFWMISLLLQLPLQGFLLFNPYFYLRVLEILVQSIMFLMLIIQLLSGYFALKYTAKQQSTYFRIMKLKSDITASNFYARYKEL